MTDLSRAEYVASAVNAAWCKSNWLVRASRCREAAEMIRAQAAHIAALAAPAGCVVWECAACSEVDASPEGSASCAKCGGYVGTLKALAAAPAVSGADELIAEGEIYAASDVEPEIRHEFRPHTPPVPVSDPAPAVAGEVDSPIDAADNADYIEHCAAKLERAGYRITGLALSAIAAEHRDHARIVAEKDARHAALVADYIELNDMHARQGLFAHKTLRRAEAAEQRAEALAGLLADIRPFLVDAAIDFAADDCPRAAKTLRAEIARIDALTGAQP